MNKKLLTTLLIVLLLLLIIAAVIMFWIAEIAEKKFARPDITSEL